VAHIAETGRAGDAIMMKAWTVGPNLAQSQGVFRMANPFSSTTLLRHAAGRSSNRAARGKTKGRFQQFLIRYRPSMSN